MIFGHYGPLAPLNKSICRASFIFAGHRGGDLNCRNFWESFVNCQIIMCGQPSTIRWIPVVQKILLVETMLELHKMIDMGCLMVWDSGGWLCRENSWFHSWKSICRSTERKCQGGDFNQLNCCIGLMEVFWVGFWIKYNASLSPRKCHTRPDLQWVSLINPSKTIDRCFLSKVIN